MHKRLIFQIFMRESIHATLFLKRGQCAAALCLSGLLVAMQMVRAHLVQPAGLRLQLLKCRGSVVKAASTNLWILQSAISQLIFPEHLAPCFLGSTQKLPQSSRISSVGYYQKMSLVCKKPSHTEGVEMGMCSWSPVRNGSSRRQELVAGQHTACLWGALWQGVPCHASRNTRPYLHRLGCCIDIPRQCAPRQSWSRPMAPSIPKADISRHGISSSASMQTGELAPLPG